MMKKTTVWIAVVLALLAWAAPVADADGPVTGRAGRAEIRYLEGMIDHHQMAVDMAQHCLTKASVEAVRSACENVIAAQTAEIVTMREWLMEWYGIEYAPVTMPELMEMMGSGAGMGMDHGNHSTNPATDMPLMMGMMAGFDRLMDLDYDLAWLESMIDHHDDALHMSTRILKIAEHEELRAMAQQIIDDQTAEIEQMEQLLKELAPPVG